MAHDVLKFCRLMTRRNGYVLEQLYSPLVVHGGPWLDELREIGAGFVVRHLVHHYRGFDHSQRKQLAAGEPTVKALLYAYRVLLTGIQVLETGRIEANLPRLLEAHPLPDVAELVARKQVGAEKGRLAQLRVQPDANLCTPPQVRIRPAADMCTPTQVRIRPDAKASRCANFKSGRTRRCEPLSTPRPAGRGGVSL